MVKLIVPCFFMSEMSEKTQKGNEIMYEFPWNFFLMIGLGN